MQGKSSDLDYILSLVLSCPPVNNAWAGNAFIPEVKYPLMPPK